MNESISHVDLWWKGRIQKADARRRPGEIRDWAGVAHWRRIAATSRREHSGGGTSIRYIISHTRVPDGEG